jgi:DNA/RNA endonuclease YhcR with UshA esterase domain
VFTVVIWGEDRSKFDKPEVTYRGQLICVTGKITSYRDIPQIVVRDPKQIEFERKRIALDERFLWR